MGGFWRLPDSQAGMKSRWPTRLLSAALVLWYGRLGFARRKPPAVVNRILVAHHLLLGDTVLLAPLLKKIRGRYPGAEVVMTCRAAYLSIFDMRPYGVSAIVFDPRDVRSFFELFRNRGFDLAILPGDNRFSWLARALDARWVVAFNGDRSGYKNWLIDEFRDFPNRPMALADLMAEQLFDGPAPLPFALGEWRPPTARKFSLPEKPFWVFHLGARTPLRHWAPEKWRHLIQDVEKNGICPVLTSGPGEAHLITAVDLERRYRSYPGDLSLPQLWQLLSQASLLICPDTGVAHLAKLIGVPTVVLYGPGSTALFGAGDFWRGARMIEVSLPAFPCRDQNLVFGRHVAWAGHCGRSSTQCASARCMAGISVGMVSSAVTDIVKAGENLTRSMPIRSGSGAIQGD